MDDYDAMDADSRQMSDADAVTARVSLMQQNLTDTHDPGADVTSAIRNVRASVTTQKGPRVVGTARAFQPEIDEALARRDAHATALAGAQATLMRDACNTNMSLKMPDNNGVLQQLRMTRESREPISHARPATVRMDASVAPLIPPSLDLNSLPLDPRGGQEESELQFAHRSRAMVATLHASVQRAEVTALAMDKVGSTSRVEMDNPDWLLVEEFCAQLVPAEPDMPACIMGTKCVARSDSMIDKCPAPLKMWQPVGEFNNWVETGALARLSADGGRCGLCILEAMNRSINDSIVRSQPKPMMAPFFFYVDRPGGLAAKHTLRHDSVPGPVLKFAPHMFQLEQRAVRYNKIFFYGTARNRAVNVTEKTVPAYRLNPNALYTDPETEESRSGTLEQRNPALVHHPQHEKCDLFTVLAREIEIYSQTVANVSEAAGAGQIRMTLAIKHLLKPMHETLLWMATTPDNELLTAVHHLNPYAELLCDQVAINKRVINSICRDKRSIDQNRLVLAVFWRIGFSLALQGYDDLESNNNIQKFLSYHSRLLDLIINHDHTTQESVVSDVALCPDMNIPASAIAMDQWMRAKNLIGAAPAAYLTGARHRQVQTTFRVEQRPRLPLQSVRSYFLPLALREACDIMHIAGRRALVAILSRCADENSVEFAYSDEAVALVVADEARRAELAPTPSTAHRSYLPSLMQRVFAPNTPEVLALVLLVVSIIDNIEDAAWLMRALFYPCENNNNNNNNFHVMDSTNLAPACKDFPHWSMQIRSNADACADWERVRNGDWIRSTTKPRNQRDIRDLPVQFLAASPLTAAIGAYQGTQLSVLAAVGVSVHVLSELEIYNASRLKSEYFEHISVLQNKVEEERAHQRSDPIAHADSVAHTRAHGLVSGFKQDEEHAKSRLYPFLVHSDRVAMSDKKSTSGGVQFSRGARYADEDYDATMRFESDSDNSIDEANSLLGRVTDLLARDPYRNERVITPMADEQYESECKSILNEVTATENYFCNDRTDTIPVPTASTPRNPVFLGAQPSARRTRVYNIRTALAERMPVVCTLERAIRRDDTSYRAFQSTPGSAGVFPAAPGTAPCEDNLLDLTPLISEMGIVRQSCEVGSFQSNVTQMDIEDTWVTSVRFILQLCCTIRDFSIRHERAMRDGKYATWATQAVLVSLLGTYRHAVTGVPFDLGWRLYSMLSIDRVACSSDNEIFVKIRSTMCDLWKIVVCALRENVFFHIASLPAYAEVICSVWKDLRLVMGVHVPDVADRIRSVMSNIWLEQSAERRANMTIVRSLLNATQRRISRYVINETEKNRATAANSSSAKSAASDTEENDALGVPQSRSKRAKSPGRGKPGRRKKTEIIFGMSDDEGDLEGDGGSSSDTDAPFGGDGGDDELADDLASLMNENLAAADGDATGESDEQILLGSKSAHKLSSKVFRRLIPNFLRIVMRISADIEREDWTDTRMRDREIENLLPPVRDVISKYVQIDLQHRIQNEPPGSALSFNVLREFNVTARSMLLLYLCNRLYVRHGRDWSIAPCLRKMRRYDFLIIWLAAQITMTHNSLRTIPVSPQMADMQYTALLSRTGIAYGSDIPAHLSCVWLCHASGCQQIKSQFVPMQSRYNYGIPGVPMAASTGLVCRHRTIERVNKPVQRRLREGDIARCVRQMQEAVRSLSGDNQNKKPADVERAVIDLKRATHEMRLSVSKIMRVSVGTMFKLPCTEDILRREPAMGFLVAIARGSMRCSAATITVAPCCGALTLTTPDRWGPNMLECGQCNLRDRRVRHGICCIGCATLFPADSLPPLAGEIQAVRGTTANKAARAAPNISGSAPPRPIPPTSPLVGTPSSTPRSSAPGTPMSCDSPGSPASSSVSSDDMLDTIYNENGMRAASSSHKKVRAGTGGGVRTNKREKLTDKVSIERYLLLDDRVEQGTGYYRVVGVCSRCIAHVPNSARTMVSSVLSYIDHARRHVYIDGVYVPV